MNNKTPLNNIEKLSLSLDLSRLLLSTCICLHTASDLLLSVIQNSGQRGSKAFKLISTAAHDTVCCYSTPIYSFLLVVAVLSV